MLQTIKAYLLSSKYLPRFNHDTNVPIFLKILSYLAIKKTLPSLDEKIQNRSISNKYNFMRRKRKILIDDEINELIVHIFFSDLNINEYQKKRDLFKLQIKSKNFCAPKYSVILNSLNLLAIVEKKISGVSLNNCDHYYLEKFLDNYLDEIKANWIYSQNSKSGKLVYETLSSSFEKIKKVLKPDSPFFNLYNFCGEPFDKKEGFWPVAPCHGQILPNNVIYSKKDEKYYFIDYEPDSMGDAPFGYDYCFFVLYGADLLSLKYKIKLKEEFMKLINKYHFQKAFLAQILWWSKNRLLNEGQIFKINKRSQLALSFFINKNN